MVEEKMLLLVNVDTLKNIVDALTKSMSTERLSWIIETMGVVGLDQSLSYPLERKQQVVECQFVLYYFHD